MAHPVTGRRALFGISGTASGIVGWDEARAIELLLELKRHALQPRFRQRARVEQGTILHLGQLLGDALRDPDRVQRRGWTPPATAPHQHQRPASRVSAMTATGNRR